MNCFIDTNLLMYAADSRDPLKRSIAADLLKETLKRDMLVLSPQSLSELFRALTKSKRGEPPVTDRATAARYVEGLRPNCRAVLDGDTVIAAIELQKLVGSQWFDSVLLASALGAACQIFWSEDMQHERDVAGMRIMNPFIASPMSILSK
ncbi:MAG: PIN domain-containing protein [Bosea sp. (in: a-proteobacteria)]